MAGGWGHLKKSLWALGGICLLLGAIGYPLYRHLAIRGLQAEAILMLSYLHSLESAYFIENGRYVVFEELYGAPIRGVDNCSQPQGARELGFLVRWCHKENVTPVRYAYRVSYETGFPATIGYRAEAISGSDDRLQSFICFGDQETDVWSMDKDKNMKRVTACD